MTELYFILSCLILTLTTPVLSLAHLEDDLPNTGLQTDELKIHRSYRSLDFHGGTHRRSERSTSNMYTVFIDAGSSGSRIWVYTWSPTSYKSTGLPDVKAVGYKKVEPGLSSHADDESAIRDVLTELIGYAKNNVSENLQAETPIYLLATAGLRMLPEEKANRVIDVVYETLTDKTICPFEVYDKDSVRILSGEEEGVFMWLAVNYLSNRLNDDEAPEATIGILELGGASTQITFIPSGILLANKFVIDIAENRYPLYVHSYLDYGQELVLRWIRKSLVKKQPEAVQLDNPCMLKGTRETKDSLTFVGSGKPAECIKILQELVYKEEADKCHPKPCAIGPAYQPSIPLKTTFYALGAFAPVLKNIKAITDDEPANLAAIKLKAMEFCSTDAEELKTRYPKVSEKYMTKSCVTSLYFNELLTRGYGFSETTDKVWVKHKINGKDIDWTLGALLYERFTHPERRISVSAAASTSGSKRVLPYGKEIIRGLLQSLL